MATAGMSPEAQELLKQHAIDVKDFAQARERYNVVLTKELVPQGSDESPDVLEVVRTAQERLKACWEEYLHSAQSYFSRLAGNYVEALVSPNEGGCSSVTLSRMSSVILTSDPLGMSKNMDSLHSASAGSESSAGAVSSTILMVQRMNDLCALGEKWYLGNEQFFELPQAEALAGVVGKGVASSSRLLRLLSMRLAYLCAGSVPFIRTLLEHPEVPQWIGFCGDRELFTELEALMNLMEHMLSLYESDTKAYPRIPFGWYYRIVSLLDPIEALSNVPPKRRSQAIRLSLRLLTVFPAQATAVSLHTVLLRNCLTNNGATPEEMSAIVKKMLEMFDTPTTRQYVHISDIGVLFAPFLDTSTSPTPETLRTLNLAKDMLVMLLTSDLGYLWVSCETTCLRSIIDVLHLPGDMDKKMVILTLFNRVLICLAPHRGITPMMTWNGADEDRRRRTAESAPLTLSLAEQSTSISFPPSNGWESAGGAPSFIDLDVSDDFVPTTKALGYHVMDPVLGRALFSLAYHGLPLALIAVLQTDGVNRSVMEPASRLLQDMFVLMDTVLPKSTVQNLHETFNRAVGRLANEGELFIGGLTSQLFHSHKASKGLETGSVTNAVVMLPTTQHTAIPAGAGAADWDDATFENTMRETKVLQYPSDFRAWNLDLLLLLVQGPLCNHRRLESALPLLRILIAFYTPRGKDEYTILRPFSALHADEVTSQTCILGIELMDLLLSTKEGAKMLDKAEFTQSVASMFQEVRDGAPYILSKERTGSRVGQTLLRLTGRLSAFANGLLLMREYGLFSLIDSLFAELQDERLTAPADGDLLQDVCYQLLQYLFLGVVPNYGVCEEVRQTFRGALGNASNSIRLCAAMQLKKAVWRDLSTSLRWGIETLVQVLHDDFFSVVESAFKLLLSICLCSDEGLDYLISLFPTVLMESEVILAHAKQLHLQLLLYRIAGRPSGFRFLQCYGWIDEELGRWERRESVAFLHLMKRMLSGEEGLVAAAGEPVGANTNAYRRRHTRTLSDTSLSGVLFKGSTPTATSGFVPPLTMDSGASTTFFPTHFAAVLCRSPEGCAMFKHSDLWSRSVACILEQPLPPDIVYDDSLSDTSDSSEGSEDMNLSGEVAYSVSVKPLTHYSVNGDAIATAHDKQGSGGRSLPPPSFGTSTNMGPTAAAHSFTLAAGATGEDAHHTINHVISQLQKGNLSSSGASSSISAARGYRPVSRSFSMACVGPIEALKDAIMVVSQVGSSDVGFSLLRATVGLQRRLTALCRFSSTMSVRSASLTGMSIIARARRAEAELVQDGYTVVNNPNAYVSADGVPYAVSFAHMKPSKSMSIAGKTAGGNTAVRHTCAESDGAGREMVSRRVWDNLFALSNPVSRESAKQVLYKMMKRHPQMFLEPNVRRLCLDVCSLYRMRHTERKFVADLLENAQLSPPPAPPPLILRGKT